MTFCRCHTNKVLRARADTLTDYWPRLARSPAPLRQKQISLRVAAWPRALYGISTTIFGQDHINKLRTRALRGLGWTNKGMHPMLIQVIGAFGRLSSHFDDLQILCPYLRLDILTDQPDRRIDPGPCGFCYKGCTPLHGLGLVMVGFWATRFAIHVFDSPVKLLKIRLQHGWWTLTCSKAAERNSMDGIAAADVALTMAFMRNIELSNQGFIRYALNVSFFTNYNLIHSGMVDHTTCPWCPAED